MTWRAWITCLGLGLGLGPVGPVAAAEIEAVIVEPAGDRAVFGSVVVEAQVYPRDLELVRVELFLDGLPMGEVRERPFRWRVDVGEENVGHHFYVVATAAAGGKAEAVVMTPELRSDLEVEVELQQLYVTVERAGSRVLDLSRSQFTVLEDGRPQRLITFERGDVPFTAVLLIDASHSMRAGRLQTALAGVRSFVRSLRRLDEAKILLFSDRRLFETAFTGFESVLTIGLGTVEAGGGTAINDHLYLALRQLDPREGRRVVILLSDGVDVESVLDMEHVARVADFTEAMVYWIRIGDAPVSAVRTSSWRDADEHRRELELLSEVVAASGGTVIQVEEVAQAEAAFVDVLAELRDQYVLGYYPDDESPPAGLARVEVKVDTPGVEVRARGRRRVRAPAHR